MANPSRERAILLLREALVLSDERANLFQPLLRRHDHVGRLIPAGHASVQHGPLLRAREPPPVEDPFRQSARCSPGRQAPVLRDVGLQRDDARKERLGDLATRGVVRAAPSGDAFVEGLAVLR